MPKNDRLINRLEEVLSDRVKNVITINEDIQKLYRVLEPDPNKVIMLLSKRSNFINMSYIERGTEFKQSPDYGLAKEVLKDYARHLLKSDLEYLTWEQMQYVLNFSQKKLAVPETGPGSMKSMSLLIFQKRLHKVREAYEIDHSTISLETLCAQANIQ